MAIFYFLEHCQNSVNNREFQCQKILQIFLDQTSKVKNSMESRKISLVNFVSEFIPLENLDQIPQELKKSSFYLNTKKLKENGNVGQRMNHQQMSNPPIFDHQPAKSQNQEMENQIGQQSGQEIENPYKYSRFMGELTNLKSHLKNMSEQHKQISNRLSRIQQNVNTFQVEQHRPQNQTSKRYGSYQKHASHKTVSKFHSKYKQREPQNHSPFFNQCPRYQKSSKKQKNYPKKSPKSESPQIFSFKGGDSQFKIVSILDAQNFRQKSNQKKQKSNNFPNKQENYASKPTKVSPIRQHNPPKGQFQQILQRVKLPSYSNQEQPNTNILQRNDKYGCSLLKQIKSYVQRPQQMRVFRIELATHCFVWGWIDKIERYLCEYKNILGVIILGGNPHIWTTTKDLMKLQFSSEDLVCRFYESMNKVWD